uniref:Uncharacterized protein n=1 Tax=Strigamia maritima TaxID=126957 RepID=T1IL00_STRMM
MANIQQHPDFPSLAMNYARQFQAPAISTAGSYQVGYSYDYAPYFVRPTSPPYVQPAAPTATATSTSVMPTASVANLPSGATSSSESRETIDWDGPRTFSQVALVEEAVERDPSLKKTDMYCWWLTRAAKKGWASLPFDTVPPRRSRTMTKYFLTQTLASTILLIPTITTTSIISM